MMPYPCKGSAGTSTQRRSDMFTAIHRTLLARDDADTTAIGAITGVLTERRQEMMQEIPASMTEVRLRINTATAW